ncbi:hypothetical protein EDB85DRAFT_2202567 [Lactarius pseudohatsudake]|nr:hypothetical protein EDB85DRAFT_2202567 [Lactarius pseudohatsudake]
MRHSLIDGLFFKSVFAAVYTDPSTLPDITYTYHCGNCPAGPGGSVSTHKLSADTNNSLLLIEERDGNIRMDPSTGLGGRSIAYPRERTLAGSTSIITLDHVQRPQVETLVPPLDSHSTTGGFDPSIHGSNGSVDISVQDTTALDFRTFNTTTQLAEFPFNEDINSGSPLGIGMFCLAHVTKVVQTDSQGCPPIFRGFQSAQSASGMETSAVTVLTMFRLTPPGSLFSRNATKEVNACRRNQRPAFTEAVRNL